MRRNIAVRVWTTVRYLQSWIRRDASLFGIRASLCFHFINLYNAHRLFGLPAFWPVLQFKPNGLPHAIALRTGTSDFSVLRQVFVEREYAVLDHLSLETIVDCGANVGYSSIYLLNTHPGARLLALEPDPDNARMCRRNLRHYGKRAEVIEAALWSQPCSLALTRGSYRDGGAWATQVHVPSDDEQTVPAIDMAAVLTAIGSNGVDLVKIDIERSEIEVFGSGRTDWLAHVKNIAIELHDEQCESTFLGSLADFEYEAGRSFELTTCLNIRSKADTAGAMSHVASRSRHAH